jgi:23S rRNA (cytidine1920-2'-O)/16S rRNA (cytidine1409-2'-O)-methyltransferase
VYSGEVRLDKPGRAVPADAPLVVRGPVHPWVSRGGLKLVKALDHFAVDVGHGQLAWSLRQDDRVVVLERTNCRSLDGTRIPEPVDLVVCDVSFIGLETALPAPLALAAPGAWLIALIKPQFEAGPENVGKGGIVRDPSVRDEVCRRIADWLANRDGWWVAGLVESPITGADGNVEYLIAARRGA